MPSRKSSTRIGVAAVGAAAVLATSTGFVVSGQQIRTAELAFKGAETMAPGAGPSFMPLCAGLLGVAVAGATGTRLAGRRTASTKTSAVIRCAGPDTIAATAVANGNFKTLVAALDKAGLVDTLSGSSAFTVFAPSDEAFAALLKELGATAEELLARPDLKDILLYHVASGTALSSSLTDGQKIPTVQGKDVVVKIADGKVTVGDATVTAADVACSNGVIHVIDKVLLPPK